MHGSFVGTTSTLPGLWSTKCVALFRAPPRGSAAWRKPLIILIVWAGQLACLLVARLPDRRPTLFSDPVGRRRRDAPPGPDDALAAGYWIGGEHVQPNDFVTPPQFPESEILVSFGTAPQPNHGRKKAS